MAARETNREPALEMHENVYEPAEDSMLLAESIRVCKGERVLDMGTGTGIQALAAAKQGADVLAVDINPDALALARKNAKNNDIDNIEFRQSDLFSGIGDSEVFDLIIFNPPYVPSHETDTLGKAWAGGIDGREVIDRFIEGFYGHLAPCGRLNILVSSFNKPGEICDLLAGKGLETRTIATMKLWFEELYVIEAEKIPQQK